MGEVYRAHDTKLNRQVAIKVLPEAYAADAERVARFHREAQAVAALNHPRIAAIYDFAQAGRDEISRAGARRGRHARRSASARDLPVDECWAFSCAIQILERAGTAHEKGHLPPRSEAGQYQGHSRRRHQDSRISVSAKFLESGHPRPNLTQITDTQRGGTMPG
jgi:serine/threonine protein kinase